MKPQKIKRSRIWGSNGFVKHCLQCHSEFSPRGRQVYCSKRCCVMSYWGRKVGLDRMKKKIYILERRIKILTLINIILRAKNGRIPFAKVKSVIKDDVSISRDEKIAIKEFTLFKKRNQDYYQITKR
jgi:hypothetical protein